jgi:hypothetical protein
MGDGGAGAGVVEGFSAFGVVDATKLKRTVVP